MIACVALIVLAVTLRATLPRRRHVIVYEGRTIASTGSCLCDILRLMSREARFDICCHPLIFQHQICQHWPLLRVNAQHAVHNGDLRASQRTQHLQRRSGMLSKPCLKQVDLAFVGDIHTHLSVFCAGTSSPLCTDFFAESLWKRKVETKMFPTTSAYAVFRVC